MSGDEYLTDPRSHPREHFSQKHLTRDERKARTEATWARIPPNGTFISIPPWYLYVGGREQSDTPDDDAKFLEERREAGDIIVEGDDGGHYVFSIGTPQLRIDQVFEMKRRTKERDEKRVRLKDIDLFREDISKDERRSLVCPSSEFLGQMAA